MTLPDDSERSSGRDDNTSITTRNPIVSYLHDVKSIPLLNREEEIALAQRIEEGEIQIADEALSSMLALRWTLGSGSKELPPD